MAEYMKIEEIEEIDDEEMNWTISCDDPSENSVSEVVYDDDNNIVGHWAPVWNWIDEQYHDVWFEGCP